jgi:hypothetical protein
MYVFFVLGLRSIQPIGIRTDSAMFNSAIVEPASFDTSKVLALIKNGIDGLNQQYPGRKITIDFSANKKNRSLIYANILLDGKLIFIYTIDSRGYSIVDYKDLRRVKKKGISSS